MKVLHITTKDNAGAGLCCVRIHQSLLAQNIESKVLTMEKTWDNPEIYQYGYKRIMLMKAVSKLLRMIGLEITEWNKVRKLGKKSHTTYSLPISPVDITKSKLIEWADIIHLHWVNNYVDLPSFFSKVRKPVVWTLHDENLFYGIAHYSKDVIDNDLEKKYASLKRDILINSSNLTVVFLSQYLQRRFSQHVIVQNKRNVVINNSVNCNRFVPIDKIKARNEYAIPLNKKVVCFLANSINEKRKGLQILVDALHEIKEIDWLILAIGGNGDNRRWDIVKSVGSVTDQHMLNSLLCCCDFMAMPSFQEAFAQSPMEAMACGLPVVVFPVSGTSELINERNGVVCTDFTLEALKKGIMTLMNRQYDSTWIRQDMMNRFSPEVIAKKYIDLYKEILG